MGSRNKTLEQFKQDIYKKYGKDFEVISDYNGHKEKVKIRHTVCNNEFETTPSILLKSDKKCPFCNNVSGFHDSQEIFEARVKNRHGDKYTVLSPYTKYNEKVKIRINECGHEMEVRADVLLREFKGCPTCRYQKIIDDRGQQFREQLKNEYNNEFILGEYFGADKPVKIKHKVCGEEWETRIHNFNGCVKCRSKEYHKELDKDFKQKLFDLVGDKFSVVGDYQSAVDRVTIKCNTCGDVRKIYPKSFMKNPTCRECIIRERAIAREQEKKQKKAEKLKEKEKSNN